MIQNRNNREKIQKSVTNNFSGNDIVDGVIIPENKLLVLGDNRLFSHDSRNYGLIDISNIVGKMLIKIF